MIQKSKIKELIKAQGSFCGEGTIDAFEKLLELEVKKACHRADANRRTTVFPRDV